MIIKRFRIYVSNLEKMDSLIKVPELMRRISCLLFEEFTETLWIFNPTHRLFANGLIAAQKGILGFLNQKMLNMILVFICIFQLMWPLHFISMYPPETSILYSLSI